MACASRVHTSHASEALSAPATCCSVWWPSTVTDDGRISTTAFSRHFLLGSTGDVICMATGCVRRRRCIWQPVFADPTGRKATSASDAHPPRWTQETRPSWQQAAAFSTTIANTAVGCSARLAATTVPSEVRLSEANYWFNQH